MFYYMQRERFLFAPGRPEGRPGAMKGCSDTINPAPAEGSCPLCRHISPGSSPRRISAQRPTGLAVLLEGTVFSVSPVVRVVGLKPTTPWSQTMCAINCATPGCLWAFQPTMGKGNITRDIAARPRHSCPPINATSEMTGWSPSPWIAAHLG